MKMINNEKGFTLVELLATMAILATLMLIAIPNVIGIVQRNKNKTYIEDAKKLETLAAYKVRSNPTELKPASGKSYCFLLPFLDKSNELSDPPNGGEYDKTMTYVIVYNSNGTLKYYVQLYENKNGSVSGGVPYNSTKDSSYLYKDDATSLVKTTGVNKTPTGAARYFWNNTKDYEATYNKAKSKINNNNNSGSLSPYGSGSSGNKNGSSNPSGGSPGPYSR